MTFTERALVACLVALYLMECVFWLRRNECGVTRLPRQAWKKHTVTAMSFTLLNRRPVIADPLLIRPGFIRVTSTDDTDEQQILRRVGHRLEELWLLMDLCRLQAFTILIYLPLVILLHRLELLWRIVLGFVITLHIAICVIAILELRHIKKDGVTTTTLSLLCNPLGALRVMDVVSQALFDRYSSTSSQKP